MENNEPNSVTPVKKESKLSRLTGVFFSMAGSFFKFFGAFFGWVFSGFGLFRKEAVDECRIITMPLHFYLYATAIVSGVAAFSVWYAPGSAAFFTWALILTIVYSAILFIGELHFWRLTFWVGVVVLAYLIARYPLAWLNLTPAFSQWLSNRHPLMNSDAFLMFAIISSFFFVGALAQAFAHGRKKVMPNAIEEWHFGRGSETMDKGGLRFRTNDPDVLELILGFGAGDLVAYDRANRIVKRYENVLFLFFRWNKLDRILHSRFANVDNVAGDAVETHDVHHVHDAADQNQPI